MTSQAVASGEVNVYTDRQIFLIGPLLKAFTQASGTKVSIVYMKGRHRGAHEGRGLQQPGRRGRRQICPNRANALKLLEFLSDDKAIDFNAGP
ncbi:MAG: hypothetical protein FD153_607 [Rhodospirillaceae bacterium]|nr:MAG: hypothetical protein FD153_607 [Rhodospirillaceae bacterium]